MSLNIELIRSSFEKAKPIAAEVADKFYEILFENHPEAKGLFTKVDLKKQGANLINSLVFIVDHLESPEKLERFLQSMGGRHVAYGTADEHYDWVGGALLQTFAFFFGDDWTEELNSEWATAYGIISEIMKEGARAKRDNVVPITESLTNDSFAFELSADIKKSIRSGVKERVAAAVKAEVELALQEAIDEVQSTIDIESKKAA